MGVIGQLPHATVLPRGRSPWYLLNRLGGFKPGLIAQQEMKISFSSQEPKKIPLLSTRSQITRWDDDNDDNKITFKATGREIVEYILFSAIIRPFLRMFAQKILKDIFKFSV